MKANIQNTFFAILLIASMAAISQTAQADISDTFAADVHLSMTLSTAEWVHSDRNDNDTDKGDEKEVSNHNLNESDGYKKPATKKTKVKKLRNAAKKKRNVKNPRNL